MHSLKRLLAIFYIFITVFITYIFYNKILYAAQSCQNCALSVNVSFAGNYLEETCEISINGGSYNETVRLPTLLANSLSKDGSEVGIQPFTVGLKECPFNRNIALIFRGSLSGVDTLTGNLINSDGQSYAKNVQVRLRKENGIAIKINDITTAQDYIIPATGEEVIHNYTASYYAKGNDSVTAGEVEAKAIIEIIYP
ncbi:fimbrial protein [[Erwinia] mediterraneensis]|uniref:fimbrial protein n=1 Tax=[Erwinia] mediterraneensis TaxID=2161819 RepID=UPI00103139ED|nr:fimbrial protein [[Erwinia] mediterraneensis]